MENLTLEQLALNEDIKEYARIKSKIDDLTKEKDNLNKKIVSALEEMKINKYECDDYQASLSYRETFKYNDEKALIDVLKKDETLNKYVVESINTKGLNDLLKKSESVATQLKENYTKTTTSSLTVKKLGE